MARSGDFLAMLAHTRTNVRLFFISLVLVTFASKVYGQNDEEAILKNRVINELPAALCVSKRCIHE